MAEPALKVRRSFWRRTLVASGASLTFVAAIAGGAVLHVGLAPTRRIVAVVLTDVLARTFTGRLVV